MRLVLDSNEYIYTFGTPGRPDCKTLILQLADHAGVVSLFVLRMVVDEIGRNLNAPRLKRCHEFWRAMGCLIDEDEAVPFGLFASYLNRGLKPADALIGVRLRRTERVGADFLISENRDFLALSKPLPFRIMKAAAFLKEILTIS